MLLYKTEHGASVLIGLADFLSFICKKALQGV